MTQNENPNSESKPTRAQVLENAKSRPTTTRARRRAKTMALIKQVQHLVDLLGPHKDAAVQVLVDQLEATRNVYHNGTLVDTVPDQIIRQKAAIAILEWLEGKPRELQMQITGKVESFSDLLERLRQSPLAREKLGSSLFALENKQSAPALPEAQQTKQHKLDGPPCGCAGPDRE